jgi:CopG family transcriptional regulator / antitoxin EndoAI
MHRRINITLSEETVRLIDRVAAKGDRSRFIAEAVHHYVTATGRAKLRVRIEESATRRAARDLQLARDWFVLDEEAWQSHAR